MSFASAIRPYVTDELEAAQHLLERGRPSDAFAHLERAHVLGQPSTREHVRVHWAMLRFGWRERDAREGVGQTLRIIGALTKTALGWVPVGNTGGANVSPFRRLPVPADLQQIIDRARTHP